MWAPTGEQYELTWGDGDGGSRVIVTQVAAGLRQYTVGGIDVAEPFPESSSPPSGAGIVLVPWPNRVKDGVWVLDGEAQELAITEPPRQNAIHGLLRYTEYRLVERGAHALTLAAHVYPQLGYPFLLDTAVRYDLGDGGLQVTHTIVNRGDRRAPVAVGAHPYLRIGDVPTGELTVMVAAATHLEVDERLNVTGRTAVDGGPYDLRAGRRVSELVLDDGWADVQIIDGVGSHTIRSADGRSVVLWGDASFGYVQVYTTHHFGTSTVSDVALAIEPMTAPANALNTGEGLRWLEPGEEWVARWGISPRGF